LAGQPAIPSACVDSAGTTRHRGAQVGNPARRGEDRGVLQEILSRAFNLFTQLRNLLPGCFVFRNDTALVR
jgi:hypothetical protein